MFDSSIETKLAAARTRLILDKPFLGALARVASPAEPVLLLCRSAVRSDAAADAATEAG